MFPVSTFVVQDVKAKTCKGGRKWNIMFSPLEVGKKWFDSELERIANLEIHQGTNTYEMRQELGRLEDNMPSSQITVTINVSN
ncbi:MAG: hypothetical protein ACHBN1_24530 [Heteroscytonema crispum UTEX LB 1556]